MHDKDCLCTDCQDQREYWQGEMARNGLANGSIWWAGERGLPVTPIHDLDADAPIAREQRPPENK